MPYQFLLIQYTANATLPEVARLRLKDGRFQKNGRKLHREEKLAITTGDIDNINEDNCQRQNDFTFLVRTME